MIKFKHTCTIQTLTLVGLGCTRSQSWTPRVAKTRNILHDENGLNLRKAWKSSTLPSTSLHHMHKYLEVHGSFCPLTTKKPGVKLFLSSEFIGLFLFPHAVQKYDCSSDGLNKSWPRLFSVLSNSKNNRSFLWPYSKPSGCNQSFWNSPHLFLKWPELQISQICC